MDEIRFTEDHEWVRIDDNGIALVGISDYAQAELGDIVFVELPEVGHEGSQGEEVAVIESVKAAGEIKLPLSGTVVAANERLADEPEIINQAPLDDGWLLKIKPESPAEFENLMDEEAYAEFIASFD
ncbi:MAG: glycine cleavage system protein GcvH [Gammaproteobacteria bacterium]|nr:glycine cleavage system protein GcvH [Gammaproteobacteria bacterium]NNM00851.1 glycine cleavage system protein GcvH [Gammaproteobacteria bacterium]